MLEDVTPLNEEDSFKLLRMYQNLHQKKIEGKFSYTSAMGLAAICAELERRGFVLSDDKTTWIMTV